MLVEEFSRMSFWTAGHFVFTHSVCNHLVSRCRVYFSNVAACLEFVQVSYQLFFHDFVIFLQCGKGFQVRKQSHSFIDRTFLDFEKTKVLQNL